MYNYVIDSLIAGINPVYLTQITGASYNIYDNVYCKKCNSIMQYNVQKIISDVQIHTHTHRATWNDGCALISFSLCTLVFSIPYILFQPLGNDI